MDAIETRALLEDVSAVMRALVSNAVAPLVARLDALDKRFAEMPAPIRQADFDSRIEAFEAKIKTESETRRIESKEKRKAAIADLKADIVAECEVLVADKIAELPTPKNGEPGRDADPEAVAEHVASIITGNIRKDFDELRDTVQDIADRVEKQASDIQNGASCLTESFVSLERGYKEAIAAIPSPKGFDLAAVAPLVEEKVAAAVAAIPAPKNGEKGDPGENGTSVTVEQVRTMLAEMVDNAVRLIPVPKNGEPGKDGIGLAGALIDRDGNLVVTTADGGTCELGPVVGKDGAPGKNGENGRDGFGFDDLDVTYDGERTFTFKFSRAADVKEFAFTLPVVLDRGVWKEGEFKAGDGVTWGGSYWIAQKDTNAKPGEGGDFRLAVKRGRDGKDGEMKPPREPKPVKVG